MIQSLVEVTQEIKQVLSILGLLSSSIHSVVRYRFWIVFISLKWNYYRIKFDEIFPLQVLQQLKERALKRAGLVEDDVTQLIEARTIARKNKDFLKSDQIRADLTAKGIALMDLGKETIWRPCVPVEQQPELAVLQDQRAPPLWSQLRRVLVPSSTHYIVTSNTYLSIQKIKKKLLIPASHPQNSEQVMWGLIFWYAFE